MSEIIQEITDTTFDGNDGFIIKTSHQEIKLGIKDGQGCCEESGYFISEDDFKDFIGSELINVKITDTLLKENDSYDIKGMYEGSTMFVDIITSKGTLQFVAYNEHNGYYGHDACVISTQLKLEVIL